MSQTRFLVGAAAALIAVMGLLSMGGLALLAVFFLGQPGQHLGAAPLLCGGGLFFAVGLFLILLVGVGRFFCFRAWKMAGGPKDERWARHWHPHHRPTRPWCWGGEDPSEEKAEGAEPDAQTGDAEPEN